VTIRAKVLRVRHGRAEVQIHGGEFATVPLDAITVVEAQP
jgi:hypothetical protein